MPEASDWMGHALSGFDTDSRMACRGFQVSMAVKVFGVGTLLPNDLSDRSEIEWTASTRGAVALQE
jgi:hypothetical protein